MIRGAIELLTPTYLSGWAADDSTPDCPLTIQVLLDHAEIARTTAVEFRQDLKDAGFGEGRHGYRATFAAPISMDARERIEARALGADGRFMPLPWLNASKPLTFAGPTEDAEARPIFVLGSPRSGTSAMVAGLLGGTRYRGYAEGHLLSLLPQLMTTVAGHYRDSAQSLSSWTMLATISQAQMEARLRALFIDVVRARFDTPYWVDKTPSNHMIAGAPLFGSIWPNARFIFMKRRAIENIASRVRKFSGEAFERHCRGWSDAMVLWTRVRDELGSRALEVDQLTLARDPEQVVALVSPFIGLSAKEHVSLGRSLAQQRTEQTGERVDAITSLEQTGWSPAHQAMFREICGPAMRAYGYSEDTRYFG